MKENLKPLMILFGFVGSVVLVFFIETTYLLDEKHEAETSVPVKAIKESMNNSIGDPGEIKEVFEDFEKLEEGANPELRHIFTYGSIKVAATKENTRGKGYSGSRAIKVTWTAEHNFGGWGKGIGHFYRIDKENDYLNFFVLYPSGNDDLLKIVLQDDDNGNGSYEEDKDDAWFSEIPLKASPEWQLFSIPVKELKDQTSGGDGTLNIAEGEGNLITFLFEFPRSGEYTKEKVWYFDHVNLTKGKIPVGKDITDIPVSMSNLYK